MSEPARRFGQRFTWADYRTWPDDERWEIIDGEAYAMAPAPLTRHQHILRELGVPMASYFKGKKCRLLWAPVDVKLAEDTVVQPDILVVCEPRQVTRTHIEGPPTLVVEILSPSSSLHDRLRKTRLYARFGVQEYWIVTPFPSMVEVFLLDGQSYRLHAAYGKEDQLVSAAFPDLKIALADVFDFPLEPGEELPVVREPPSAYRAAK
jgi:Uma2 family endonuclease